VNPLTAGGIMNTLEATDLLVRCVADTRRPLPQRLARYNSAWRRRYRLEQSVFLVLQRIYLDSSDEEVARMLVRGQRALSGLTDRSRPFRWPVATLAALLFALGRKGWPHRRALAW
jgi:flavin-dependent dehydrogenase